MEELVYGVGGIPKMLFSIMSWESPEVSKPLLRKDGAVKAHEGLKGGKQVII